MVERGFMLLDCQIASDHLLSMGAKPMNRTDFLSLISTQKNTAISWL
jgi:Leu/Phe-tRNA-protein transferase